MADILFSVPGVINGRFLGLILDIAMAALVYYYMTSGKTIHIRRIPGLDAI